MAKRRTARAGARKRKSAGGAPRTRSTRARRTAVRSVSATSNDSGGSYATIAEVAARAESDPDFFKAIVRGRANLNEVLGREGLQLSPADERTLKVGLGTVVDVARQFKGLGGWGRWPVMPPFD